jgi:transcription elongation GreA/GreB family factor
VPNADSFYILDADKQWARIRIAEIEKAIDDLGPEFEEVFSQSTETWHDNAPFDALRDKQSLMAAERHSLRSVLNKAAIACPKPAKGKVGLGSLVGVADGQKNHSYFIAGNWSPSIGHVVDGALVISCVSPLGKVLVGRTVGATVTLERPAKQLVIESIQN